MSLIYKGVGYIYFLGTFMETLIKDLWAMQRLDYVKGSMGYNLLQRAIETLDRYNRLDQLKEDSHWEKGL